MSAASPALLRFLQHFMRMYAHGMKNRLTPAVTALYMLEEDPGAGPERVKSLVDMTLRSHGAALALLSSLDNMSEIEPEAPQPVNWAEFLKSHAGSLGVELEVLPPAGDVTLDLGLWTVIVRELLANVRDHGGKKAKLIWSVNQGRMKLEVADAGPGLGTMAPERALEASRKGESSPGVGLGLAKALYAAVLLDGTLDLYKLPQGVSAVVDAALAG
jgi:signal transduction histidine kinase